MRVPGRAFPASILYTPCHSDEKLIAARRFDADVHLMDLEDSVPRSQKDAARILCHRVLEDSPTNNVAVRINALGTTAGIADLQMLSHVERTPDLVFMTMVRSAAEPIILRELFADAGRHPDVYVTIETIEAVRAIDEIAAASDGMILGSADLCATLSVEVNVEALVATRQTMALAAAGHDIACIDTGNFHLGDAAALASEIEYTRALGFHGKGTVHPKELDAINAAFRPNADELQRARQVVVAVAAAGGGVAMIDGRMIGPPFVRRAKELLEHGELWQSRFGSRAQESTEGGM